WCDLLGLARVSRHDSFFALGGHSLLAVQMINRVAALGAELPLAILFARPTLAGLATAIQDLLGDRTVVRPPITPMARDGALPLSFAQKRLWFLAQLEGICDAYHIPLALRVRGPLDVHAWQQTLDTLWARHEALRSVFVSTAGQPEVRLLDPALGLPLHLIEPHDASQLAALCAAEVRAPFDLAVGPLIRASLIRLADNDHVFLLTQHHIVSDGWSFGVLLAEFSALYSAYRNRQPNPLPPLAVQYPDYACWQRQWLCEERLQEQANYWRAQLADAPVRLDLPTDRPRPARQS
ncbi:condensation domain-containing protein, partial [Burkholderia ubonensis]|uniref:condensation domain-containing protein n=1 Tax=Burkholderia ubonensis TaxID=101571 RepID=UPI000A943AFA